MKRGDDYLDILYSSGDYDVMEPPFVCGDEVEGIFEVSVICVLRVINLLYLVFPVFFFYILY